MVFTFKLPFNMTSIAKSVLATILAFFGVLDESCKVALLIISMSKTARRRQVVMTVFNSVVQLHKNDEDVQGNRRAG